MNTELFKPGNLSNLTEEQIAQMQTLTPEEIQKLGQLYPNDNGRTYITLKDTSQKDNNQLFPASTWQNLAELHRLGKTNFVAFAPSKNFKRVVEGPEAPVQDLTKEQAQSELKALKGKAKTTAPKTATEQTGIPLDQMNLEQLQERFRDVHGEEPGELDEDFLRTSLSQEAAPIAPVKKAATKVAAPKKAAAKKAGK